MPRSRTKKTVTGRNKSIRYAVIGLGHIAQAAVLPAFEHARRNSQLAALVSGEEKKLKALGRRYGVKRLCGYEDIDGLFSSGEIDAVYIALPNDMHKDFTIRAARAGLHVLCEKPMAVSARDCEQMISATETANVRLMIAYRLHFERANLEAMQLARSGKLGDLRFFSSDFSMQVGGAIYAWRERTAVGHCMTSASIASTRLAIAYPKIPLKFARPRPRVEIRAFARSTRQWWAPCASRMSVWRASHAVLAQRIDLPTR